MRKGRRGRRRYLGHSRHRWRAVVRRGLALCVRHMCARGRVHRCRRGDRRRRVVHGGVRLRDARRKMRVRRGLRHGTLRVRHSQWQEMRGLLRRWLVHRRHRGRRRRWHFGLRHGASTGCVEHALIAQVRLCMARISYALTCRIAGSTILFSSSAWKSA